MTDALKSHILRRAIRLLTAPELSKRLGTSEDVLQTRLDGKTEMPQASFLALVDVMRVLDQPAST